MTELSGSHAKKIYLFFIISQEKENNFLSLSLSEKVLKVAQIFDHLKKSIC